MNITRSADGLINHHGAIPEDELWIKLGGDKGRGSFKFNFQLVNTSHPNSVKKTVLVSYLKLEIVPVTSTQPWIDIKSTLMRLRACRSSKN